MSLRFEWDAAKAAANLKKHGVSFDEATSVFHDPLAAIFEDEPHSSTERREIIIGHSLTGRFLLVVFVERTEDHIRLISARKATLREKHDYEAHR